MPTITVHDQTIFYAHHHNHSLPDQPALLLIHGAMGSHLDWPAALRQLPNTAVYAIDLPGHGRSDPPARSTISAYADIVVSLITALDLPRVVITGHSMGGAIAQEIATRQPAFLAGLVLLGTSARLRVSPMILSTARTQPEVVVDFVLTHALNPDVPAALRHQARQQLSQVDPDVIYSDFAACQQFDLRQQLDQIQVPALVISGAEDEMVPAKYGRSLADALPDANYINLPATGHYLMLEQPTAVANAIQTFLSDTFTP